MQLQAVRTNLHVNAARVPEFRVRADERRVFRKDECAEFDLAVFGMENPRLDPAGGQPFVSDRSAGRDAAGFIAHQRHVQTGNAFRCDGRLFETNEIVPCLV